MTDFKSFKGAAKRLDDIDLPKLGALMKVGEDEIHAFIDTETSGSGFDTKGRPKILFEPHVFYRNLSGAKRDLAVKAKLAYANWGEQPYPSDSYPRLIKAIAIDETAALKAASWGLAQVLGENFKEAGYQTPQAMVLDFLEDEENHLNAAVNFIIATKIDDNLRNHDWAGFAKVYNGNGYKKNGYHTKLARAYAKWSKIKDTPYSAPTPVAVSRPTPTASLPRALDDSKLIENVQQLLRDKGYPEVGIADNKMGNRTRNAILAFEADNGLPLTGKVSDGLLAALVKASVRQNSAARETATTSDLKEIGVPTVKVGDQLKKFAQGILGAMGLGAVGQGVTNFDDMKTKLDSMKGLYETVMSLSPWLIGAAVAGGALYFGSRILHEQVEAYRAGHSV